MKHHSNAVGVIVALLPAGAYRVTVTKEGFADDARSRSQQQPVMITDYVFHY